MRLAPGLADALILLLPRLRRRSSNPNKNLPGTAPITNPLVEWSVRVLVWRVRVGRPPNLA